MSLRLARFFFRLSLILSLVFVFGLLGVSRSSSLVEMTFTHYIFRHRWQGLVRDVSLGQKRFDLAEDGQSVDSQRESLPLSYILSLSCIW